MEAEMHRTKLIFLNVGWMERYEGLNGDIISGGGSFIAKHRYGHEMFNFLPWEGRMYGYAETKQVSIERLGARPKARSVSGILAIWVARRPESGGTVIVGWYDNAILYREAQEAIFAANRRIDEYITKNIRADPADAGRYAHYIVSAAADDCQLLLPKDRTFEVPRRGKGNMGRRNLWYADSPNKVDFRNQVVGYVNEHVEKASQADNLLRRKYGWGGEGTEHKLLKEWCANNPQELGLNDVREIPGKMEYRFISGDIADIVFKIADDQYAVLEIETTNPEPGAYQALKYKTLLCSENGLPIESDRVRAILVAWQVPSRVRDFCRQYGIQYFEKRAKGRL